MPYTDEGKNLMLAALAGANPATPITHVSVHSGDPTLGNEISGGDPAYARKPIGFQTPAAGQMEDDGDVQFDIPADTWCRYVAGWSAVSGGVMLAYAAITEQYFGSQGVLKLTQSLLNLNLTES